MAKKGKVVNKFVFKGFENLALTLEERESIIAWQDALETDAVDCVVVLCEAGYKVGISYDDYRGCMQGALTCKDAASRYYGYCFTLSHMEPSRLLCAMRWFYDTMLRDEIYVLGATSRSLDW